jgi:hypothetical protein
MAAALSFLINVAISLISSSRLVCALSSNRPLPVPKVADLASVVPMLNVSPNMRSFAFALVLGGNLCLTRLRSQRRRRTKLWNQGWLPCQAEPLNSILYCHPSSSTSRLMSTYHVFQSHTQLGSGTWAFVMLTAEGLNLASCQGAGSILKFHSALLEKSGMPNTNHPRWFSYKISMWELGFVGAC